MGERTSYTPGTLCWTELHTPDRGAAKRFYDELFGWQSEDAPVGDDMTYTVASRDGKAVAAMSDLMGGGQEPPNWFNYVATDDVDASARAVADNGGSVVMEPFDVMEAGRMAVATDPQGAYFGLWQAGDSIGAELVNGPSLMSFHQLNASDVGQARPFYEQVFGWRFDEVEDSPEQEYWLVFNGANAQAGAMPRADGMQAPPHWMVYFGHEDLDAASGEIERLGGGVEVPPTPVPAGRFLVAQDPTGAYFALVEAESYDP